jgi:AcrR family transcriptional regulator
MTIEERRDREKQQMKEMILQTAANIILAEGFEKLSIRKIANRIDYSPAIIYHYFKNKDEILSQILRRGHQDFTASLSEGLGQAATPEARLKILSRNYIMAALKDPGQFLAVQLNDSPEVLEFTAYMFENAVEKKPVLNTLYQAVREVAGEDVSKREIEMTSQIIAASTLGLIVKLTLERNIGENQRNEIIDRFAEAVVRMASLREEGPAARKEAKGELK